MCSLATKASWSDRRLTFLRLGRCIPSSPPTKRVGNAVGSPYELTYIERRSQRLRSRACNQVASANFKSMHSSGPISGGHSSNASDQALGSEWSIPPKSGLQCSCIRTYFSKLLFSEWAEAGASIAILGSRCCLSIGPRRRRTGNEATITK